jgi:hypothetical protein
MVLVGRVGSDSSMVALRYGNDGILSSLTSSPGLKSCYELLDKLDVGILMSLHESERRRECYRRRVHARQQYSSDTWQQLAFIPCCSLLSLKDADHDSFTSTNIVQLPTFLISSG